MAKADKLPLNTTLDPVTYAVLSVFAAREDVGRGAANVPLRRLVREELQRELPGAWDALVDNAGLPDAAGLPSRELAVKLIDRLAAVLRERVSR